MRFLSVAERELRAAARQKGTYRVRWITAAAFFGLLVWMTWAFDGFTRRGSGPAIFQGLSVVTFFYCVIIGGTQTADCLSREKREGTLGLLFLTNLNSAEIIAGKLCSSALTAGYGLCAVFPLLALPLLLGGVTFACFWRTVLALVNALFFAVAVGFAASGVSVRQFPAIGLATGVSLLFSLGFLGAAEALRVFGCPPLCVEGVAVFSPLYTLWASETSRRLFGGNQYWLSLALVASLSWTWLAATVWRLGRTWRDRGRGRRVFGRSVIAQRWPSGGSRARVALRHRLLSINPFFWLASRQQVSAPIFMLLTLVLVLITVEVTTRYFGTAITGGAMSPLLGHLFAWFWTVLAIHGLVLYFAATAASQRLAEDKQSGALELILSTPANGRSISRGLWLAYGRRIFAPVLIAALVHFFFIWHAAALFILDPPGQVPVRASVGQLIWSAVFNLPIDGNSLEWHFGFIMRVLLLALLVQAANVATLGWLGRWLGLCMKHPGFAPLTAVALVLVPPGLLFSLVCFVFDRLGLDRMPERRLLPLMMWVVLGIVMGNGLLLSAWSAGRWSRDFRTTVTSRFQPSAPRRWWRPARRTWLRCAAGAATLALAIAGYYGYQNWRSRRAWAAFQQELKQRGETLDLSALLPGPVPDAQNFARTAAFRSLLKEDRSDHSPAGSLLESLNRVHPDSGGDNSATPRWMRQEFADLDKPLEWIQPDAYPTAAASRRQAASAVLDGLQPLAAALGGVAAARLPYFQTSSHRDAGAVRSPDVRALSTLQRVHFLFVLRASAQLALHCPEEAGEDLLVSLRLAALARQSPDGAASTRVQGMLAGSLQPLWEGMAERRWSDPQLAAVQAELEAFDLLSDHTNTIHRLVRSYIETWSAIPDGAAPRPAPPGSGWSDPTPAQRMQPRAWWFDNCIQLYRAGCKSLDGVDVPGARVRQISLWEDLNGLPLEGEDSQLIQQSYWWGPYPGSVAFAQTAVNQAIIACSLERYYLAMGNYPETLDSLVPAYLRRIPNDIVRGGPMQYERTGAGRYVLRGVGPNGIKDQNKQATDDWLWQYPVPTNAPPAAAGGEPLP